MLASQTLFLCSRRSILKNGANSTATYLLGGDSGNPRQSIQELPAIARLPALRLVSGCERVADDAGGLKSNLAGHCHLYWPSHQYFSAGLPIFFPFYLFLAVNYTRPVN